MKNKTEPSLEELRKEINQLKKKKEKELLFAKSYEQRNKLLKEISDLELIKKSPSALKNFGKTFVRGLKITGRGLWKAIQKGSRNLEMNTPEFQTMAKKKQTPQQPFSDLGLMYLPKSRPLNVPIKTKKLIKTKSRKKKKKSSYKKKPLTTKPIWEME